MKFEEVLPMMREGKKARHGRMKVGEYWVLGKNCIGRDEWPTLIKVFHNPFQKDNDIYSWGIERWAILDETWEIID